MSRMEFLQVSACLYSLYSLPCMTPLMVASFCIFQHYNCPVKVVDTQVTCLNVATLEKGPWQRPDIAWNDAPEPKTRGMWRTEVQQISSASSCPQGPQDMRCCETVNDIHRWRRDWLRNMNALYSGQSGLLLPLKYSQRLQR